MAADVALQQLQTLMTNLRTIAQNGLTESQEIDFELAVDAVARDIINASIQQKDADELFDQLLGIRALTIHHVPVDGINENNLAFNMIQNIPLSPICSAHNKMAFPTISKGNNFVCIRLDPTKALDCVPETVKNACPVEGEKMDLFYTVIRGGFYQNQNLPLNNQVGPWAQIYPSPDETTSCIVNMGIFPEIGLQQSNGTGAIAFNQLSPKSVDFNKDSSDNAHFNLVSDSPFSVDWFVIRKDDRGAIIKRVILVDENHPICHAIITSAYGCRHLSDHLESLNGISAAIENTFEPVTAAFESDDPSAMQKYHQLPPAFKHNICAETWVSFGSPLNIHPDFGKASIEKDKNLDEQYHSNPWQISAAVQRFSARLKHLLVDSQMDLLLHSQSLVKGDNVVAMMKCAKLFYEKPYTKAVEAVYKLPELGAIHEAFWKLKGCVREFSPDLDSAEERKLKSQSVLFAASRQPHRFEQPPIERNGVDGKELSLDSASPSFNNATQPFQKTNGNRIREDDDVRVEESDEKEALPPSSAYSSSSSSSSTPPRPSTTTATTPQVKLKEDVNNQIINVVYHPEFRNWSNVVKARAVNQILAQLPEYLRNDIYGQVWHTSFDQNKSSGNPNWGRDHVADDLSVLAEALQQVLG